MFGIAYSGHTETTKRVDRLLFFTHYAYTILSEGGKHQLFKKIYIYTYGMYLRLAKVAPTNDTFVMHNVLRLGKCSGNKYKF